MEKCDIYTTESCQENSLIYSNDAAAQTAACAKINDALALQARSVSRLPDQISMDQKLAAAREWLGDRYLCANPIQKRSKR